MENLYLTNENFIYNCTTGIRLDSLPLSNFSGYLEFTEMATGSIAVSLYLALQTRFVLFAEKKPHKMRKYFNESGSFLYTAYSNCIFIFVLL